jgi:hypothetical protein
MKKRTKKIHKKTQPRIVPNDGKFRELLLLIAQRSEGDPFYGSLKLNKLLFYSDFLAYLRLGKPITGQEYFALANGPAPRYMMLFREQMLKAGEIAIRKKDTVSGADRILALRESDYTQFSGPEMALIAEVIAMCAGHSGTDLSIFTHRFSGWRLADDKETIPYSVALVGNRLPNKEEREFGATLEAVAAQCVEGEGAPAIG